MQNQYLQSYLHVSLINFYQFCELSVFEPYLKGFAQDHIEDNYILHIPKITMEIYT